ncbi:hypothetical protein AJ88_10260 [Mesorhizobium amorphae CCBAU 01583]|nr:hypothetical protein AJ88_10260 [Mesorhizobium amorphae CCBAU 01583]
MGEMSGRTEGGAVPPTYHCLDWFIPRFVILGLDPRMTTSMFAFLRAPLCPAGHLPHKGGDWQLCGRL